MQVTADLLVGGTIRAGGAFGVKEYTAACPRFTADCWAVALHVRKKKKVTGSLHSYSS